MHTTRKTIYTVVIAAAALVFGAYTSAGASPARAAASRKSSTQQSSKQTQSKAAPKTPSQGTAADDNSPGSAKARSSTSQVSSARANSQGAAPAAQSSALATDKQKESYALGMNVARRLKHEPVDLDEAELLRGLKDELDGKPQLSEQEFETNLKALAAEAKAAEDAQKVKAAEENMKEGEAFLAANKTKPGVKVLPSGLQYKIEKEGTGPKPTAGDTVVCNYRGTFVDGKEFDSSYERGKPITFPVTGVIKGWTEALQLMPVGSKWELFIPSDLAYGPSGRGPIGPNTALVFEVELLSIQAKK